MRARVPGSSANLGPGFDTLGVALALYTEVTVEPAASLALTVTGEGADLPADEEHLAVQVVRSVLGHDRVAITVTSEIPVSRGLGSSAALAVASAAAAGLHDTVQLIGLVARLEGHGDNAAASVLGGLVTASLQDGDVLPMRWCSIQSSRSSRSYRIDAFRRSRRARSCRSSSPVTTPSSTSDGSVR